VNPAYGGQRHQAESTLVPGTLRGYRKWHIRDGRLKAIAQPVFWDSPELRAQCVVTRPGTYQQHVNPNHEHVAPDPGHTCGIYACHSPYDAQILPHTARTPLSSEVIGVIEASGNIEVGPRGYRAERARIVALCMTTDVEILSYDVERGEEVTTLADMQPVFLATGYSIRFMPSGGGQVDTFKLQRRGAPDPVYFKQSVLAEIHRRKIMLEARYPDVPWFSDYASMVTAFPPISVDALLPEGVTQYVPPGNGPIGVIGEFIKYTVAQLTPKLAADLDRLQRGLQDIVERTAEAYRRAELARIERLKQQIRPLHHFNPKDHW